MPTHVNVSYETAAQHDPQPPVDTASAERRAAAAAAEKTKPTTAKETEK
jgi:hypothetical protein